MTMTKNKLNETVYEMQKRMDCKQRENGEWFASFKSAYIGENDSYYNALSNALHEFQASEDFRYQTLYNFLEWMEDNQFETIEDAQDSIFEFCDTEIPVYTSDLTKWLSESNYHVYYLEQAVIEHGQTEGFKILSSAYYFAVSELAYEILNAIEDLS